MMAKRKKSTIMPESKDNKIEETALPLVRTSDEPVTKKVGYMLI
jgi:ribosome biogenesis protein BRX1